MSDAPFESFEDFWPFYVREHSHPANRRLHFAGTTGALLSLASAAVTGRWRRALLAPVFGYGAAWIGHFFIEKNKPATFQHPLWSLRGDFVMYAKILAGTMDAEVERCTSEVDVQPAPPRPAHVTPAVNVRTKDGVLH